MEQFTGKVWILGDDIDTDIIIPTEYLALPTVEDMKQYGNLYQKQYYPALQTRFCHKLMTDTVTSVYVC